MLQTNFAEIKNYNNLSSKDIQSIIDLIQNIVIFFEENHLNYDVDTKLQLNKTLKKIKDSLLLEEKKYQEIDISSNKEATNKSSSSQNTQVPLSKNINNATKGSLKWIMLIEKIEVLKSLIDSGRIFEASIVYNDIQNLLANFDPKEYFPEIFFPLYQKIAPFISNIHKTIDYYSSSIEWSIAEKMYNIDYNKFLHKLEKMPENNFLNSFSDNFLNSFSEVNKNYFYETFFRSKKTPTKNHKIMTDIDAIKEEIEIKQHTKKNQNSTTEGISDQLDENYFEDFFNM